MKKRKYLKIMIISLFIFYQFFGLKNTTTILAATGCSGIVSYNCAQWDGDESKCISPSYGGFCCTWFGLKSWCRKKSCIGIPVEVSCKYCGCTWEGTTTTTTSSTTTTTTICECTSGSCCDGCNFRPSTYVCDPSYGYDYDCLYGTACGQDVYRETTRRHCSGSSSNCNGAIYGNGDHVLYDDCTSSERCADNNPICNYDPSCVAATGCELGRYLEPICNIRSNQCLYGEVGHCQPGECTKISGSKTGVCIISTGSNGDCGNPIVYANCEKCFNPNDPSLDGDQCIISYGTDCLQSDTGKWDYTQAKCVKCYGRIQNAICGDTSNIYPGCSGQSMLCNKMCHSTVPSDLDEHDAEQCLVKDLECPVQLGHGQQFTVNYKISGTDGNKPYEIQVYKIDGQWEDCRWTDDESECIWNNKQSLTLTAPTTAENPGGSFTVRVGCLGASDPYSAYCLSLLDDYKECTINFAAGEGMSCKSSEDCAYGLVCDFKDLIRGSIYPGVCVKCDEYTHVQTTGAGIPPYDTCESTDWDHDWSTAGSYGSYCTAFPECDGSHPSKCVIVEGGSIYDAIGYCNSRCYYQDSEYSKEGCTCVICGQWDESPPSSCDGADPWQTGGEALIGNCCGDDTGENLMECDGYPVRDSNWLSWYPCDDNIYDIEACCDSSNDCVFNDNCYATGGYDINSDGVLEYCNQGDWWDCKYTEPNADEYCPPDYCLDSGGNQGGGLCDAYDSSCYGGYPTDSCGKSLTSGTDVCQDGCSVTYYSCTDSDGDTVNDKCASLTGYCNANTACSGGVCGSSYCDSTRRCSSGSGNDRYSTGGAYYCQGSCDGSGNCDYAVNCQYGDQGQAACETCGGWVWTGDGGQYNCCGDDGLSDDYCSGGFTACLNGNYYIDGDANYYNCNCGGGYWNIGGEVPEYNKCCGNDGGEYRRISSAQFLDNSYGSGDGTDACCSASTDCVDDGECTDNTVTKDADLDDDQDYCDVGTWVDCDSDSHCDSPLWFCENNDCKRHYLIVESIELSYWDPSQEEWIISDLVDPIPGSNRLMNVTVKITNSTSVDFCLIKIFNSTDSYSNPTIGSLTGDIRKVDSLTVCNSTWDMEYWRNPGQWNVSVNLSDTVSNFTSKNFTYNSLNSIVYTPDDIIFFSGYPGDTDIHSTNAYPMSVLNNGNVVVDIKISGDDFVGQFNPTYRIDEDNVTFSETQQTWEQLEENEKIALYHLNPTTTRYLYFNMSVPIGFISQDYQNNINIVSDQI